MFRFAHPIYLYLLAILPVLALFYLYVVVAGKKAIKRFSDPMLVSQLTPEVSRKRERLKFWLLFTSIAVTVFMIAGPQFGSKPLKL